MKKKSRSKVGGPAQRHIPDPGPITAIQAQKKSSDRVSVFISGTFGLGIHADVLMDRDLSVGTYLSEEDIASLQHEDAYFRAREMAYNLLSYRQRSVSEIRTRLSAKGVQPDVIARVLDRLEELEMVNDEQYAIEYASARVRSKGYGPLRLRNELFRKGIESQIVETAILRAYDGRTLSDLAMEAGRSIHTRLSRIEDPRKRKHQLTTFLARRGFSYDEMEGAVKDLESVFGNN